MSSTSSHHNIMGNEKCTKMRTLLTSRGLSSLLPRSSPPSREGKAVGNAFHSLQIEEVLGTWTSKDIRENVYTQNKATLLPPTGATFHNTIIRYF